MRYLSRNKIYQKVDPHKEAKKIYIFCEGEDKEVRYFSFFQGFSSNINIIPIPNNNGQSDPIKLKENANLLFFGNETTPKKFDLSIEYKDEVWFAIDTDRWNEGNKIKQLKEFCTTNNKDKRQWYVAQSNPCFEIWLYYHFDEVKPNENEVSKFDGFKTFVNDKIKGGFDNRKMPIEFQSAIQNSLKNFESENDQPKLYSTEIHILGTVILPFIEIQLKKAKDILKTET